jgi:hypothetical protein
MMKFVALLLSHIETPTGIMTVEAGKLMDLINQQQIKTYAIFPAKLPYVPAITGLASVATTPVSQPTPTARPEMTATPPATVAPSPSPMVLPATTPAPEGKGCLLGMLDPLLSLFR